MSASELEAGAHRRSKDIQTVDGVQLEALWEQTTGERTATTHPLTMQVNKGVNSSLDTMTLSQGSTFSETIALNPVVYRLLAGGHGEGAERTETLAERFVLSSGQPGFEKVSVDRHALVQRIELERPVEMARAHRLLALERLKPATLRLPVSKRTALFVERWKVEDIDSRIDATVRAVPSRALLLMAGRDQVALWLGREKLTADSRLLQPDLAGSILRPVASAVAVSPVVTAKAQAQEVDLYLSISHRSGSERVLLVDLTQFRKAVQMLEAEEDRSSAIAALGEMVSRSAVLGLKSRADRDRQTTPSVIAA